MSPEEILAGVYHTVAADPDTPRIEQDAIRERVALVSRNISNRAGVRLILTCALAQVHDPSVDVRKPYTEIGGGDTFSGRTYDETYISAFVREHELPCNPTTAFLTPALRNRNTVLTPGLNMSGRPKAVYDALLQLLDDAHTGQITGEQLLAETIRQLVLFRDEKQRRMESLLDGLKSRHEDVEISAEQIVTIVEQHLANRGSSRLPVLVIAAVYRARHLLVHLGKRCAVTE